MLAEFVLLLRVGSSSPVASGGLLPCPSKDVVSMIAGDDSAAVATASGGCEGSVDEEAAGIVVVVVELECCCFCSSQTESDILCLDLQRGVCCSGTLLSVRRM